MIRAIVDFALNHRFLVLAAAVLLMIGGTISFHDLPVEAYPSFHFITYRWKRIRMLPITTSRWSRNGPVVQRKKSSSR